MLWLLITILSYFFFALVSLIDRYLLAGPLPHPKVYAFYVGMLGLLALVLVPLGFYFPGIENLFWSLLAGAVWILATYFLYLAIYHNEVSRVIPAINGLLPVLTYFILVITSFEKGLIDWKYLLPLLFLISGSVLITLKKPSLSLQDLKFPLMAAIFFAFGFLLMKRVYLTQPFISGFIWMRLGGVLTGLLFLVLGNIKETVFQKKPITQKKVLLPFIFAQVFSAGAFFLQNYAVVLARLDQIPLINALEGTRYLFLLGLVFILAKKAPHLLKEEMEGRVLKQKLIATLLIIIGFAFLASLK